MGCRCTRRRRRSSGEARRRGPHPRFIDATASCEPSPGSAVGHALAGQPRCRQRFRAGSEKSPSSRCPQAAAACGALHATSDYMPASQARTGIRHEEGPGAARERAAPLRHSAAHCRVENHTHAAQARLHTHVCAIEHLLTTNLRLCQNARHRTSLAAAADMKLRCSGRHEAQVRGDAVHARENTSPARIGLAAQPGSWWWRLRSPKKLVHTFLSEHADLGACYGARGHNGPDDGDFVPAARKARRLDVLKQHQPAARCTHPLPICPLRRPAGGPSTAFSSRLLDSLASLPFGGCNVQ